MYKNTIVLIIVHSCSSELYYQRTYCSNGILITSIKYTLIISKQRNKSYFMLSLEILTQFKSLSDESKESIQENQSNDNNDEEEVFLFLITFWFKKE